MKKIALVAACDRYNYGDVLMPILFEKYYELSGNNAACFDYFALSYADLRRVGGKITRPITTITDEYQFVIIAGGEVLSASYRTMWANLQTNNLRVAMMKILARISVGFANHICRHLLHGSTVGPWSFFKKSDSQRVYYNSVGGQRLDSINENAKKEIKKLIESSDSFSVRDNKTLTCVQSLNPNIKSYLMPDTAIIMSVLFPVKELRSLATSSVIDIVDRYEKYFVVQVSKSFGNDIYEDIALAVNKIYETLNTKCVLLPIGRAQGHEDEIPLKRIKNVCKKDACIFIEDNNIYDVMLLISNSIAFLGTSLHGVVTAASYFVSHALINPKCTKTRTFMKTWKTSSTDIVDGTDEIYDFILKSTCKTNVDKDKVVEMQNIILQNFRLIVNEIDEIEA